MVCVLTRRVCCCSVWSLFVCVLSAGRGDQACFLWEGNDLGQDKVMTYKQVLDEVCQLVSVTGWGGVVTGVVTGVVKQQSREACRGCVCVARGVGSGGGLVNQWVGTAVPSPSLRGGWLAGFCWRGVRLVGVLLGGTRAVKRI